MRLGGRAARPSCLPGMRRNARTACATAAAALNADPTQNAPYNILSKTVWPTQFTPPHQKWHKKLSYRRRTARCVVSGEILPIATQQCRNYLYDQSWTNRSYKVGSYSGPMCSLINMCTQPWRDRVASIAPYRCHKQTDHGPSCGYHL